MKIFVSLPAGRQVSAFVAIFNVPAGEPDS